MTKPNFTEIIIVLDRSGSMEMVRDDTIGGFNAFIEDQKKAVGEAKITLVQFDDQYLVVYGGQPIQDVPKLTLETFVPRGMTALLDAVGKTINIVGDRLANTTEDQRPSLVLFVIITDGHENASKEFKLSQIKDKIKHQTEKYNWEFVFLGADQDAFQAGAMGVSAGNTFNYSSDATIGTYAAFSATVSDVRARGTGIKDICDMMREKTKDKSNDVTN